MREQASRRNPRIRPSCTVTTSHQELASTLLDPLRRLRNWLPLIPGRVPVDTSTAAVSVAEQRYHLEDPVPVRPTIAQVCLGSVNEAHGDQRPLLDDAGDAATPSDLESVKAEMRARS